MSGLEHISCLGDTLVVGQCKICAAQTRGPMRQLEEIDDDGMNHNIPSYSDIDRQLTVWNTSN